MTREERPPRTDGEEGPDPDNSAFKKAIDNVFTKAAKRSRQQARDAAQRVSEAQRRADDAQDRHRSRRSDH